MPHLLFIPVDTHCINYAIHKPHHTPGIIIQLTLEEESCALTTRTSLRVRRKGKRLSDYKCHPKSFIVISRRLDPHLSTKLMLPLSLSNLSNPTTPVPSSAPISQSSNTPIQPRPPK